MLQYGPTLAVLNTTKTNTRIRIFHTRVTVSLDITCNYSSRFVQYPHYPIACCLFTFVWWPTTATAKALTSRQKKNLTVKRITSPCSKKKKTRSKKKNLTAERKRLKAKRKPHGKKKKTRGKISSIPRGHFNSYFFCRKVVVILSALRLFFCRDSCGPPYL